MTFEIVGRRGWWYLVSAIVLIPGVIALLTGGIKPGIDFTGGSLLQVRFDEPPAQETVRDAAVALGFPEAVVQTSIEGDTLIRARDLDIEEKDTLLEGLAGRVGDLEELGFSSIGPVVGEELTRAAIIAVVVASVLILLYTTWAFRHMDHPVLYGAAAVAALGHDALLIVGVFAVLGHILELQIDALFVTAVLTVIGFSVNDTIVVFDRVRENRRRHLSIPEARRPGIAATVNFSLNQSLTRSLNTSFTALLVLLSLILIGGPTIRIFVIALAVGFAAGTYSSIFNAACLVVSWELNDAGRLWRRMRSGGAGSTSYDASAAG